MIEVHLDRGPQAPQVPERIVRHDVNPCRCPSSIVRLGDVCWRCGRHTLGDILEGAEGWYRALRDETLRRHREEAT